MDTEEKEACDDGGDEGQEDGCHHLTPVHCFGSCYSKPSRDDEEDPQGQYCRDRVGKDDGIDQAAEENCNKAQDGLHSFAPFLRLQGREANSRKASRKCF